MTFNLAISTDNNSVLIPANATKDVRSRLGKFCAWLNDNGFSWYSPDLRSYRDYLQGTLSPSSCNAHLSTIRSQYKTILADNETRDTLYNLASQFSNDALEKKAFVEEVLTRLANDVNPIHSSVKIEKKQDVVDSENIRLDVAQCETLMQWPDYQLLSGLRDRAIIAFAIATGLRESELCNLQVEDLRQTVNGVLGVYVREGKGCKSRFVPYGNFEQVLAVVDKWLHAAGIKSGKVFRGFRHHSQSVTDGLTGRAVQDILKKYPVYINGELRIIKPHDLRRTYARLLYDGGMDIVSIQQNLGHSNLQTTLNYIGNTDIEKRKPKVTLHFRLEW